MDRLKNSHIADCLESVDWTTGLEYWNGLNYCKRAFFDNYDSFLESGYSLSHFRNFLHAPLTSDSGACLAVLP